MSLEKFFEKETTVKHSLDDVWKIFSNVQLISKWHPLMIKSEDTENKNESIFIQKITKNGVVHNVFFIISMIESKEKEIIKYSVRRKIWNIDQKHNIVELSFKKNDKDKTQIKFTRYFDWEYLDKTDIEEKRKELINFAEQIFFSITHLNYGSVAEWLNAPVLKTGEDESPP